MLMFFWDNEIGLYIKQRKSDIFQVYSSIIIPPNKILGNNDQIIITIVINAVIFIIIMTDN